MRDQYVYADFNGLNWVTWGYLLREQVAAGMSDEDFYQGVTRLVAQLDDQHSVYQSPAAAGVTAAIIQGRYQGVGLGIETAQRPALNGVVVLRVYPDGPAWKAGLAAARPDSGAG